MTAPPLPLGLYNGDTNTPSLSPTQVTKPPNPLEVLAAQQSPN